MYSLAYYSQNSTNTPHIFSVSSSTVDAFFLKNCQNHFRKSLINFFLSEFFFLLQPTPILTPFAKSSCHILKEHFFRPLRITVHNDTFCNFFITFFYNQDSKNMTLCIVDFFFFKNCILDKFCIYDIY